MPQTHGLSRRLRRAILSSPLGLAVAVTSGCSTGPVQQAPSPQPPSAAQQAVRADLDNNWRPFGAPPLFQGGESGLKVAVIHVENRVSGGRLDRLPGRHGMAAVDISDRAADRAAGRNVRAEFIDGSAHFGADNLRAAMRRTRVVTNSERAWATGTMNIDAACTFFDGLPGLLVVPAGNEGRGSDAVIQPQDPNPVQCADVVLRVGALEEGKVAAYSTRSGIDLVGENPYREGLYFQYLPRVEEFDEMMRTQRSALLGQFIRDRRGDEMRRLERAIESARAAELGNPEASAIWASSMRQYRELQSGHGPGIARFIAESTEKFNEKVAQLRTQLIASRGEAASTPNRPAPQATERRFDPQAGSEGSTPTPDRRRPDANNFVHEMHGTSFTTPAVGGYIAGRAWREPGTSVEELMVAALVTARKLGAAHLLQGGMVWLQGARGLLYNPSHAGFGVFDPAGFDAAVARMNYYRQNNLASAPRRVPNAQAEATAAAGDLRRGVALDMVADGVTLRTQLILVLPKMPEHTPIVELVSPSGTVIPVVPAAHRGDHDSGVWTINTSAFLGADTAGRWTVRAPTDAPALVQLRSVAVQHGSTIDRIVTDYGNQQRPAPGAVSTVPAATWVGTPAPSRRAAALATPRPS